MKPWGRLGAAAWREEGLRAWIPGLWEKGPGGLGLLGLRERGWGTWTPDLREEGVGGLDSWV